MKKQVAQERFGGYIFLLPALILLGLFLFLPTLLSIYYSFTDYYMLTPQDRSFIGIGNYITLFKDPLFIKSLWNIGKFVIFIMPIQVGTALGLALLVNKKEKAILFSKLLSLLQ